jgi:hypothetical protein
LQAVEGTSFILDVSNDPVNLLGTTFLDYALYLASLLHIRISHLEGLLLCPPLPVERRRSTSEFLRETLKVYERRLPYYKLTRLYSTKLMKVYEVYFDVDEDPAQKSRFRISLEYGSIDNLEERVDGHEEQLIKEFLQALSSDSTPSPESVSRTVASVRPPPPQTATIEAAGDVRGDHIFDIDSLLAVQSAAEAISACLPSPNNDWWDDIFGQDPHFEALENV